MATGWDRQEELQGTLKFKDTQSGKGQAESYDPYKRQHKGQQAKEKVKVEALSTCFYSLPSYGFKRALKWISIMLQLSKILNERKS